MDNEETELSAAQFALTYGIDFSQRTIYVFGEINEARAFHFCVALERLDSTEGDIRVVLSSQGGEEDYGYAIYDCMRMSRNRIVVEGRGCIASIAAIIFQGGDERILTQNAEYLIHNGSIEGMPDHVQQDQVKLMAEQIIQNNEKYYKILSDNSSMTVEEVEDACKNETCYSAKEAVSFRFADKIVKYTKTIKRKKK